MGSGNQSLRPRPTTSGQMTRTGGNCAASAAATKALGGAVGVPIAVDPSSISDTIANNCFDHAATTVTTRISLDGVVVASPQTRLGAKGDFATVATMKRVNGAFCSETAGIGGPDLQCQ